MVSFVGFVGVVAGRLGVGPLAAASFEPPPPLPVQRPAPPLPAVLIAPPPEDGPVVDTETAEAVVVEIWRIRERAILERQLEPLRAVESGAVLWDDEERVVNGWQPERDHVADPRILSVGVPRFDAYPAYFLAQLRTTNWGDDYLKLMVFVRGQPGDNWRLALDTNWPTDSPDPIHLEDDDEGFNATDVFPAEFDPTQFHAFLTRYYQHWKDHGRELRPTPFDEGSWTTGEGRELAKYRNHTEQANGLVEHWTFFPEPDPFHHWLFRAEHMALVCSSVWYDVETEGGRQHADRAGWGAELRPGVYERLVYRGVYMSCIGVPDAVSPVVVFGGKGSSHVVESDPPGVEPLMTRPWPGRAASTR